MARNQSEEPPIIAIQRHVVFGLLAIILVSALIGFNVDALGFASGDLFIAAGVVGTIQLVLRFIRKRLDK